MRQLSASAALPQGGLLVGHLPFGRRVVAALAGVDDQVAEVVVVFVASRDDDRVCAFCGRAGDAGLQLTVDPGLEAASCLSVVVRSCPVGTAVNGRLVARREDDPDIQLRGWLYSDRRVRPVLGDQRLVTKSPGARGSWVGDSSFPAPSPPCEVSGLQAE